MRISNRNALVTWASAALVLLASFATPIDAEGVAGGGLSPIGVPVQALDTYVLEHGPFDASCELLAANGPDVTSTQSRSSVTQPSVDVVKTFDGVLGTDNLDMHSDDTGTFWATAVSRSRNHNEERPRIESEVFWGQTFRKESEDAYVHFKVSSAQLSVWEALDGTRNNGACARIQAVAVLFNEAGDETDSFFEDAILHPDGRLSPDPVGPMTFSTKRESINGYNKLTRNFDEFFGNIDLSSVDVGQEFQVWFVSSAIAGSGFSEFPAEVVAAYLDPVTTGGGVTVEVNGLTPLNSASSTPIPRDQTHAQAIQPDGKLVSAGYAFNGTNYDFALARYLANGSLDASFDGDGKLTTDFGAGDDQANAVAIQADGKVLVAGRASNGQNDDLAVVRYSADGSLDTSFGTGGKVQLDVSGTGDSAQAIAVQADGKILIAGYSGSGTQDMVLARLNADGSRDANFGTNCVVTTDIAGNSDLAKAIAVQPDGKIVIAGYADLGSTATRTDFALARYNSDGTLDSGFGTGGKVTTDFSGGDDYIEALTLQPDGKLGVAGHHSGSAGNADIALARYNADGSLDAAFGTQGKVTTDVSSSNDYAYALALQPDGKLVIGGYTAGATRDFAVLRYTAAGVLDTQFGTGGKVQLDFAGKDDQADTLSIQSDGKIVVAGWAATTTGDDFAMARLNP